jgi:hypothetical protein
MNSARLLSSVNPLDTAPLVMLISLALAAEMSAESARFPGTTDIIAAPGGRYVIHNVDNDGPPPNHALVLEDRKTSKRDVLHSYRRYVDVSWAPDGSALLVTDHGGSDSASCLAFRVTGSHRSFEEDFRATVSRELAPPGAHHVYVECKGWISSETARVEVHGYGDGGEFARTYEWTPGRFITPEKSDGASGDSGT